MARGPMEYAPIKYTVYGMIGLTVMGMGAMSAQLGGAVLGGVADVAGQLSVLLPEAPDRFEEGRRTAGYTGDPIEPN